MRKRVAHIEPIKNAPTASGIAKYSFLLVAVKYARMLMVIPRAPPNLQSFYATMLPSTLYSVSILPECIFDSSGLNNVMANTIRSTDTPNRTKEKNFRYLEVNF